jgi:sialic acid synthase SpsE
MIPFFRERYGCFVGLSDHSGTIYPGIAAATIGSDVVEVHVLVARAPLSAGTVLTEAHLSAKKPGTGIPAERLSDVIGRRLRRDVAPDEVIREDDLERV